MRSSRAEKDGGMAQVVSKHGVNSGLQDVDGMGWDGMGSINRRRKKRYTLGGVHKRSETVHTRVLS